MDLTSYLIPENKTGNEFATKIHELVNSDKLSLLEFTYLRDLDKTDGGIVNSSWAIDICKQINDKDFNDIIIKRFDKLFKKNDEADNIKLSANNLLRDIKKSCKNFSFTSDQKNALKNIFNFLSNKNEKTFGLYGYAGTGKTTTLVELVYFLLDKKLIKSVALTAPTHQALSVIKSKFRSHIKQLYNKITKLAPDDAMDFDEMIEKLKENSVVIDFITIHKLLDFKSDFSAEGERIFTRDGDASLESYEFIVIDECSMIPADIMDHIFFEINKRIEKSDSNYKKNPKIMFSGDPAQLPPVSEDNTLLFYFDLKKEFTFTMFKKLTALQDNTNAFANVTSDTLNDRYNNLITNVSAMKNVTLKEVVRSKIDSIVNVCYELRRWVIGDIELPNLKKFIRGDAVSLYKYDNKIKKIDTEWFKKALEEIKKGVTANIILTWTNKQSDEYNNKIRSILFPNKVIDKYEVGDILKLNDFYNFDEMENGTKFYASQQIKVVEISKVNKTVEGFETKLNKKVTSLKNSPYIESKFKPIIKEINSLTIRRYKVWKLGVIRVSEKMDVYAKDEVSTIYVVEDSSSDQWEKDKKLAFEKINTLRAQLVSGLRTKTRQIDDNVIVPLRNEYHKIFVAPFANTSYFHSATCHSSQGSNFYNVYVDVHDILRNIKLPETKKCLYTAVTRTSNQLCMLI